MNAEEKGNTLSFIVDDLPWKLQKEFFISAQSSFPDLVLNKDGEFVLHF